MSDDARKQMKVEIQGDGADIFVIVDGVKVARRGRPIGRVGVTIDVSESLSRWRLRS